MPTTHPHHTLSEHDLVEISEQSIEWLDVFKDIFELLKNFHYSIAVILSRLVSFIPFVGVIFDGFVNLLKLNSFFKASSGHKRFSSGVQCASGVLMLAVAVIGIVVPPLGFSMLVSGLSLSVCVTAFKWSRTFFKARQARAELKQLYQRGPRGSEEHEAYLRQQQALYNKRFAKFLSSTAKVSYSSVFLITFIVGGCVAGGGFPAAIAMLVCSMVYFVSKAVIALTKRSSSHKAATFSARQSRQSPSMQVPGDDPADQPVEQKGDVRHDDKASSTQPVVQTEIQSDQIGGHMPSESSASCSQDTVDLPDDALCVDGDVFYDALEESSSSGDMPISNQSVIIEKSTPKDRLSHTEAQTDFIQSCAHELESYVSNKSAHAQDDDHWHAQPMTLEKAPLDVADNASLSINHTQADIDVAVSHFLQEEERTLAHVVVHRRDDAMLQEDKSEKVSGQAIKSAEEKEEEGEGGATKEQASDETEGGVAFHH